MWEWVPYMRMLIKLVQFTCQWNHLYKAFGYVFQDLFWCSEEAYYILLDDQRHEILRSRQTNNNKKHYKPIMPFTQNATLPSTYILINSSTGSLSLGIAGSSRASPIMVLRCLQSPIVAEKNRPCDLKSQFLVGVHSNVLSRGTYPPPSRLRRPLPNG